MHIICIYIFWLSSQCVLSCISRVWLFVIPKTITCKLLCPWNSPGKNTGVGSIPFCRGSSWPRDQIQVSWIEGRFFTIWATMEAPYSLLSFLQNDATISKPVYWHQYIQIQSISIIINISHGILIYHTHFPLTPVCFLSPGTHKSVFLFYNFVILRVFMFI